jgi:hypothetical protein
MSAQGSIDHLYRVSADTAVIGGWCSFTHPSAILLWRVEGEVSTAVELGCFRIRRPDVLEALSASDAGGVELDCGFVAVLRGIPSDAFTLHVEMNGLALTCSLTDLRSLGLSEAVDQLIALTHWGTTPADVVHAVIRHQDLGWAVYRLVQASCNKAKVDLGFASQLAALDLDRKPKMALMLIGSHDPNMLYLQLVAMLEALSLYAQRVACLLVASPVWCMLDAYERVHLANSLALLSNHGLTVVEPKALTASSLGIADQLRELASSMTFLVLGPSLLPRSSAVFSMLPEGLMFPPQAATARRSINFEQSALSTRNVFGVEDLCCFLYGRDGHLHLNPAPAAVWSLFHDLSCVEPSLETGQIKGLTYWRDVIRRVVLSLLGIEGENS